MQDSTNPKPPTRDGGNDDGSKTTSYRKYGDAEKKGEKVAEPRRAEPEDNAG